MTLKIEISVWLKEYLEISNDQNLQVSFEELDLKQTLEVLSLPSRVRKSSDSCSSPGKFLLNV